MTRSTSIHYITPSYANKRCPQRIGLKHKPETNTNLGQQQTRNETTFDTTNFEQKTDGNQGGVNFMVSMNLRNNQMQTGWDVIQGVL